MEQRHSTYSIQIHYIKETMTDHDALRQIAEDGGLQLKRLPPDDGVRQRELQEKGLEYRQQSRRSKTETFGR